MNNRQRAREVITEDKRAKERLNDHTMDAIIRALGRHPVLPRRRLQQMTSHRKTNRWHFQYALDLLLEDGYVWSDKEGAFMLSDHQYHPRIGPCPVCGK